MSKPNPFRLPHKYYRHLWSNTLSEIGTLDFSEDEDINSAYNLFLKLEESYVKLHSAVENEMAEILVKPKDEELHKKWVGDHEKSQDVYDEISMSFLDIRKEKDPITRTELGEIVYGNLQNMYTLTLRHMEFEETVVNDFLHQNYLWPEIIKCEQEAFSKAMKELNLQETIEFMGDLFGANSLVEQYAVIMITRGTLKMKDGTKEDWDAALNVFQSKCSSKRWEKIKKSLELKY